MPGHSEGREGGTKRKVSALEETLALHIRAAKLDGGMEREYRAFAIATGGTGKGCKERIAKAGYQDWRIDFAWPDKKLAVEVEGGTWTGGRHTRGAGFESDTKKYNSLTLMGWRLLRFTGTAIKSGVALQSIQAALSVEWSGSWEVAA